MKRTLKTPIITTTHHKLRVEKTREQREHARGTLRDLPRNTQAQKQCIISHFIARGKKGLTIGTRQT